MGELTALHEGLHVAEGALGRTPLGRRMSVVRAADGRLAVINAMRLDEIGMRALDALGPVGWILVPNSFHGMDAPWYAARYPAAQVLLSPGAVARLGKRMAFHGTLADAWPPELEGVLKHMPIDGLRMGESVFLHEPSRSLIVSDLVFNLGDEARGLSRLILRLTGSLNRFGPTRVLRYLLLKDRAALYASIKRLLEWDFERVIVSHGDILEQDGRPALERAFRGMLGLSPQPGLQGRQRRADESQLEAALTQGRPTPARQKDLASFEALLAFRKRLPEQRVTLGGVKWGVRDTGGSGPVLVMLPGTLGTSEIYWQQIEALRNAVRVIAFTWPQVADVQRYVAGIRSYLDQQKIAQVSIQGSSLGGFVAQLFAATHPERVQTLFIGNSLCRPHENMRRPRTAEQVEATAPSVFRKESIARTATFPEDDAGLRLLKQVMTEQGEHQIPARNLKARILALLLAQDIPPQTLPDERIVIFDSGDDPIIPPEVRPQVRERHPGAEICHFETGGHFPYISRAEQYTAVLRRRLLG